MISQTSQCATCGRQVPRTHSLFGDLCPACILGAGRTPGSTVAETHDPTTWAEVFPQLEVEATLIESDGLSIYRARVLDSDPPENAILQVLTGGALGAAGGPPLLEARMHHLTAQPIEDLAPVLDFGDLADAFFLITAVPDLPTLAEAEPVGESLHTVMTHSRHILQAAWAEGIALAMFPQTTFFDPESGRTIWLPALQPDDSGTGGSDREVAPVEIAPGRSLGPYTLIECAGEGGFGEVWQARQERPVVRNVALKILKSGLHSKRARSRFEVEQQSLAALDHPHIARFYDGGISPDGRPYFAMEWLDGQPLNRHCERSETPLAERLRLFRQVCEAVHHAHQKGIIHRDLKPSNVMVTTNGGPATAKVIDFGIARAVEDPDRDRTQLTRAEEVLGTPASMSPEQAAGAGGKDLDARTDVYGLGVLLYELLTGKLPFDPKLPADELRRRIREDDPPKPSQRVPSKENSRVLKGDLDWITMRCLEKDPARRYGSVSALLVDLERHANDEPVEAGPPKWSYRVRKFVRRNRTLVGAATTACLAIIAGLLVAVAGYRNARASEHEAREAESLAEERLAEEKSVVDFVHGLLFADDAWLGQRNTTYEQLLERAVDLLDRDAFPDPKRWMHLQGNIAVSLQESGELNRAISLLEEIHEYRTQQGLPPSPFSANLARTYLDVGRHEEGLELTREYYEYLRDHGDSSPTALLGATSDFLESLCKAKRWDEASTVADEAWRQFNLLLDTVYIGDCNNLSIGFGLLEQYDRVIAILRHGVAEGTRSLDVTDPVILNQKYCLTQAYEKSGRYRAAAGVYEEILRFEEEIPGRERPGQHPVLDALAPAHIGYRLRIARANLPLELLSEGQDFLASGEKELARERFLLGLMWEFATNPSRCVADPPWTGLEDLLLGLDQCDDEVPRAPSLIHPASTWAAYCGVGEDGEAETGWNQPGFDAASWREAKAPLGYGDESLASEVWEVQPGEPKPTTVYFRKEFEVDEIGPSELLVARIRADDGAGLYLNGAEVARLRFPDGPLHAETFATSGVGGVNEGHFQTLLIDRSLLKKGSNLLAVEVHQISADSSDVIFDLELLWDPQLANLSAALARFDPGPVIERIRQEGRGEMPPLPPFAPSLAAAQVLALNSQWEAALQMTEPVLAQVAQGSESARVVARFRSHCLKALGRPEEAQKALALGVPERSKEALPKHLDLTRHYTAYLDESLFGEGHPDPRHLNQLRLPADDLQGVIEAGQHSFEVRGVIHLHKRGHMLDLPREVRGIEINACAGTIHFLHALHEMYAEEQSDEEWNPASYVITYTDGTTVEIPVRRQDHDIDCSDLPTETAERFYPDGGFIPTWKGPPVAAFFTGYTVLYVKSWTNPRPEVPVRSIDVISSGDPEAPALMLFGITTEPVPGRNEEAP